MARGYALHVTYEEETKPQTVYTNVCEAHDSDGECTRFGSRSDTEYVKHRKRIETPVAIDIHAEREKMVTLSHIIRDLRYQADQERIICLAEYELNKKG